MDDVFCFFFVGNMVENLYVIGFVLVGFDFIVEGCGGGVCVVSVFQVVYYIVECVGEQ